MSKETSGKLSPTRKFGQLLANIKKEVILYENCG